MPVDRRRLFDERGRRLADVRQRQLERARADATFAWDASPISTARVSAELWAQIKDSDWALVSPIEFVSRWPMRLWNFDKPYQFIGAAGGARGGYRAPPSLRAPLAHKKNRPPPPRIHGHRGPMDAPRALSAAGHHK